MANQSKNLAETVSTKHTKTSQKTSKSSLCITGSKKLTIKEIYRLELALEKAIRNNLSIITGDEDGTDQIVIMCCNGKKYSRFTVIGSFGSCAYFANYGENEVYIKSSSSRDKDIVERAKKFIIVGRDGRQARIQGYLEKSGKEFVRIVED